MSVHYAVHTEKNKSYLNEYDNWCGPTESDRKQWSLRAPDTSTWPFSWPSVESTESSVDTPPEETVVARVAYEEDEASPTRPLSDDSIPWDVPENPEGLVVPMSSEEILDEALQQSAILRQFLNIPGISTEEQKTSRGFAVSLIDRCGKQMNNSAILRK